MLPLARPLFDFAKLRAGFLHAVAKPILLVIGYRDPCGVGRRVVGLFFKAVLRPLQVGQKVFIVSPQAGKFIVRGLRDLPVIREQVDFGDGDENAFHKWSVEVKDAGTLCAGRGQGKAARAKSRKTASGARCIGV